MDLFTYLMAKNGNNSSVHGDLFSYLLGKGHSQTYTVSGVTIYIPNAKKLVSLIMTKESTQATSILPSEYTQVDYIETTGTQYINTNYYLQSSQLEIKTKLYVPTLPITGEQDIVSNQDNTTNRFVFGLYGSQFFGYSRVGSATADASVYSADLTAPNIFEIELKYDYANNLKTMIVNGNTTTEVQNKQIAPSNNPIRLFSNGSAVTSLFRGRIYYLRLIDNNQLVRDFIPCYRNSDNEVGLYDYVNGVFYTNSRTDSFTYGSVVETPTEDFPTPSPDYPQEVKTVKGYRNSLNISNYYVRETRTNVEVNLTTGSLIATDDRNYANKMVWFNIPVENETTYKINYKNNTFTKIQYTFSEQSLSTWAEVNALTRTDVPSTETITSSDVNLIIILTMNNAVLEASIDNLIITEGTQELPYVPYGNNYVDVKVIGKNLFDGQIEIGGIDATTGQNVTSNYRTRSKNYIEVQPNTTYTFSKEGGQYRHILAYDKNKNYLSINLEFTSNTYTFTTNSETKYIRWYDTQYTNINEHVQIEEGTIATEYEPYKETIVPIPLNGNEIVGIGNYLDELIVDKSGHVLIEKNTAKIDSYNGETITTTYMSTTGGLDTGATVYYGIDTPQLIDLQTTVDLKLFKGVNNISNSEDGYMTIEYK